MPEKTYWNGERTKARKVRVLVGESPVPTWWCANLAGTIRQAVEVTYDGRRFFLDDEDGKGWRKVTEGHGSPSWGSASLPDTSRVVAEGDPPMSKAYEYVGEPIYVDGVPMGSWQRPGDAYTTTDGPLWEGDICISDQARKLRHIKALVQNMDTDTNRSAIIALLAYIAEEDEDE